MSTNIDLHIHTTISDGAYTPKQVIDMAIENGVNTIAISDHDSIDAYTNELYMYAKERNINIIHAVEISTKFNKIGIHVLGYDFDLNNKELIEALYRNRNARHIYLREVAERLQELGYYLNVEELDKVEAVTKAHIALDIINNEKNKEKLLQEFNHIPEKGEFIEIVMNEGCPAYVKKEVLTPKEAAEYIRKANGKAVLAHPVAYCHEDGLTQDDIQEIVNDMRPDGIEANYIYADRNNEVFDETDKWNEFARKNNLFVTIGSDFHNKDGVRPEIGFRNMDFSIESKTEEIIISNLANQKIQDDTLFR